MRHLANLTGTEWYVELAKLLRGKTTYEALLAKAKSASNLAELYYYWSDLLLARGRLEQAHAMWKKVIETDMMAFYEFEMAAFNLLHGPTRVVTQSIERKPRPRSSSRTSSPRPSSN
jgi:lipoprotein NlpI